MTPGSRGRRGRASRGRSRSRRSTERRWSHEFLLAAAVLRAEQELTLDDRARRRRAAADVAVALDGAPTQLGLSWREDDAEPGAVFVTRVVPHSPAAARASSCTTASTRSTANRSPTATLCWRGCASCWPTSRDVAAVRSRNRRPHPHGRRRPATADRRRRAMRRCRSGRSAVGSRQ